MIYIVIVAFITINVFDTQIPILNVNYEKIHTPTDYKFFQSYPPSFASVLVTGIANQTITMQIHISCETLIIENTPVRIEVEAGVGNWYADNLSRIDVGFFGAEYQGYSPVNNEGYVFWTGFAGVSLYENHPLENDLMIMPDGGTELGGDIENIFWRTAGDKYLSIVLNWANEPAGYYRYTYDSSIPVYAYADLRSYQFSFIGGFAIIGGLLFGIFEVYPSIRGKN